jgi:hypothetical protein
MKLINKNIFFIILAAFICSSENSLEAMKRKAEEIEQDSSFILFLTLDFKNELSDVIESEDFNKLEEFIEISVRCSMESCLLDSILRKALNLGKLEVVKYLIEKKQVDNEYIGSIPLLFEAIKYGHIEIIKYLIEVQKANIGLIDENRYSLAGFKISALGMAIKFDYLEVVKYLIEDQNADVERVYENENETYSACGAAIKWGTLEIAKYLIKKLKVNIESVCTIDRATFSALGIAISADDNLEMVRYLIEEQKADTASVSRDYDGCNLPALVCAIDCDSINTVKHLVENQGVDVSGCDPSWILGGDSQEKISVWELIRFLPSSSEKSAIASYARHVENYYKNNIVDVNWPCNYFCLASFLEKNDDMREFIKDKRCVLKPEDKRSLIIGVHDRQKYKALQELFWLFKISEQEVKSLPIDKKKISEYLIQTNTFKKVHDENFEDVAFVLHDTNEK